MSKTRGAAVFVVPLVLLLLLTGSGGETIPQEPVRERAAEAAPFPDFGRDPRYSPMIAQYEAILRGEGTFLAGAEKVDLQHIKRSVSSDDRVTAAAEEFAVVDMDGDSAVEVVLRLTVNGYEGEAYVILHCYGGDIYGDTLFIRQFGTLKENGTLSYTRGIRLLQFDGGKLIYDDAVSAYREESAEITGYQKNGSVIYKYCTEYFINDESVTKDAYDQMMETYCRGQRDAKWYGLSFIERRVHFPAIPMP